MNGRRQSFAATAALLAVLTGLWPGVGLGQHFGGYGPAAGQGDEAVDQGAGAGEGMLPGAARRSGAPAASSRALPDRQANLLVSWRVVSSGQGSASREGLRRGEVIVDSRRGVAGRGTIGWSSSRSTYGGSAVQQVMVMNGGRARIDVRQYSPRTVWQWAGWVNGTPRPGRGGLVNPEVQAGVVGQTVWIDSGHGLAVRPQWPGGAAPVTLELEAEAPVPRDPLGRREDDAPPAGVWTQTTLRVPLGQWVEVARTQRQGEAERGGGTWRTESQQEDEAVLQVQVSRP